MSVTFDDGMGASINGVRGDAISSRAGLLPICLANLPIKALAEIPVYLRTSAAEGIGSGKTGDSFTLYSAGSVCFDENRRQHCLALGVRFVYIPIAAHDRFLKQTESQIEDIAGDAGMAASAKWAVVYQTSTELANELLSQRNFTANLPRLQAVSKAVTKLVLNDPMAFGHLFATSHHDFYTATHMVNVGTWMVALAYAMGHSGERQLCTIFEAGMLHDVGKSLVSKETLNKTGQLSTDEWASLRAHPALGCAYLERAGVTDPTILAVTREHHERLDGSGYPDALRGDQIHPISRMCAVVDTFDALTALRPFKMRSATVAEAMEVIFQESPARYAREVVAAWTDLVRNVDASIGTPAVPETPKRQRRKHERFDFNCPVLVRLQEENVRLEDSETIGASARNISAAGMSLLMPVPVAIRQIVRLHLQTPRQVRVSKTYDARCVRCRAYDDGWFEVGVEFLAGK